MAPAATKPGPRGGWGGKKGPPAARDGRQMEPRGLEKFPSPGRGTGLRVLKRVPPGELLYRAEPFACTVIKARLGGVCERCLRRSEQLLRCSQCKVARYCGARCQKEAWQEHKRECKCLRSIDPHFPPDSVRLVGRIVFKLLRQSAACASEKLYSFSDLQSNIGELSEEMKEGLRHLAQTLQLYLKVEVPDAFQLLPAIDIFQIFAKVTCNCFTISNGEMQDVGVGLYPSMSLLNHSCDPNCVIVFEGCQLLLRSVREIQSGEELTISYIDSLMSSSERQKHLKRQYCFECNCLLCQTQEKETRDLQLLLFPPQDADMLAGEEQAWKEIKDAVIKVGNPSSQEEWEQTLAMCQALLNNNADRLPDTNIYLLKMLDCALDACINLRRWEEALLYGNRTLKPYRLYYSGFHPLRAVQLMRVGKLQYSQDMFPQALETLKQAYNIMKVTHGADHSLIQDLMKIKEQCEAGMRAQ